MLSMLAELAAAAGAAAAVSAGAGGAGGVDQAPLPRWVDSSEGVHEFLTMDIAYKGQDAAIKAAAARFDFIWGSSVPGAWRNVSSAVVPSLYTPYAWDGGWGGNLTWWQTNHPDWVLYKCDRTTPAYWNMIKANVPFDMSNRDAVQFHYDQIRRSFAPGYKAVAADMFYLENTANACGESTALSPLPLIFSHKSEKSLCGAGVWRTPTDSSANESAAPQWVQLFSGASSGDPQWGAAQIRWAQHFRSLLHAHEPPLLLIPNYSLLGRSWNDTLLQQLLGAVDGILDEQGYSNYAGMNSGATYFDNLLKHQTNVQQKGCAYYQINEVKNTSANATRRFVVGSYLQGRNNASAVFMSFPQDYGEVVGRIAEFDAPVGRALGPATEPYPGCWVREFSHAVVAVNANKVNASVCSLPLDNKRFSYEDVYGRQVEGSAVKVVPVDAAILLRYNRSSASVYE